jgi:hypothetical protein
MKMCSFGSMPPLEPINIKREPSTFDITSSQPPFTKSKENKKRKASSLTTTYADQQRGDSPRPGSVWNNGQRVEPISHSSPKIELTGGGGCLFKAIDKMIPDVLTMGDLDDQIPTVRELHPNLSEGEAGVPGEQWSIACLLLALKTKKRNNPNFDFRLTKFKGFEFERALSTRKGGMFLVIGTLNRLLYPTEDQEGDWCHCVAVDTDKQRIFDGNSDSWLKMKDFPLYESSMSAPDDRLLTSIRSVYTLTCTRA